MGCQRDSCEAARRERQRGRAATNAAARAIFTERQGAPSGGRVGGVGHVDLRYR